MEMDLVLLGQILTVVLAVGAGYVGKHFLVVRSLLKELGESFTVTSKAIEDGKMTPEELKLVIKEWTDVLNVFRGMK